MHIKLTDKFSKYAPPSVRSLFHPACKWLGTVTVDDGRRGALMETPDGVYNMVQSYRQTFPLNADNVTLALAEALAATNRAPKESRPQGRPPENGAPMRQYMVSLTEAMAQAASDVGAGNISRGVRRMVQEYMNAHR